MSPSKQADTRQNYEDLAEALFSKIDVDNDQKVRLDEFVDFYYLEQRQLIEQIEETKLRISDSKTRADQIQIKIADLQPQEKYTNNPHPYLSQGFVQPPEGYNTWHIMKGSVLQVNVIDARNLVSKKSGRKYVTSQVKLSIEGQSQRTQEVYNTNDPVWNEVIAFDIFKGNEPLELSVIDVTEKDNKQ